MEKDIARLGKSNKNDMALLNIEALLNLIPYTGGFVATYFSEIRNKRIEQRVNTYLTYIIDLLKNIEQTKSISTTCFQTNPRGCIPPTNPGRVSRRHPSNRGCHPPIFRAAAALRSHRTGHWLGPFPGTA